MSKLARRRPTLGGRRALGACVASIALLSGCGVSDQGPAARPPEVRLEGVQFHAYRDGALTASGTAATATYLRSSGEVAGTDVRATIPRPGAPALSVEAPAVQGDLPARTWSATGGVVMHRGDATARTASARYAGADGLVRGDEPVEITGPGYRLAGPSFVADPARGDLQIRGGVRVVAEGVAR